MEADKRKIWYHKRLKVVPVSCQHPTWGKCGEGKRFDKAGLPTINESGRWSERYWQIKMPDGFPNGSWITVGTKQAAREFIERHPDWQPH